MFKKLSSFLLVLFLVTNASATTTTKNTKARKHGSLPIQTSLIVDGKTGKILHASNSKEIIYPASLTKVMTMYMLFEALESGKIGMNDKFYVSKHASQALPLKLYLQPGEKISVKDSIRAIIIKSANDVSRVVAENIADGSESKFARLMTLKAHQLGMEDTNFTNASGWHDPKQVTTAVDLAKLSIAIERDFPQYYHFFRETSFSYKGKTINGHNRVTATYQGSKGLKTGYTGPAGCNLITSATRGNKSLIGVVTGRKSAAVRDRHMVELLDKHFGVANQVKVVKKSAKPSRKIVKLASRNK
jgi:D-alanyl-D-alanine carboxypeptidase (penicillin-binding protein 5/6)